MPLSAEHHSPIASSFSIWLLSAALHLSRSPVTPMLLPPIHILDFVLSDLLTAFNSRPFSHVESAAPLTPFSTDSPPTHWASLCLLCRIFYFFRLQNIAAVFWALSAQLYFIILSHPTAFNIIHADKCHIYSPRAELSFQKVTLYESCNFRCFRAIQVSTSRI